jgi:hypothetical protein
MPPPRSADHEIFENTKSVTPSWFKSKATGFPTRILIFVGVYTILASADGCNAIRLTPAADAAAAYADKDFSNPAANGTGRWLDSGWSRVARFI